jgi:hypothetical protein
MTHDTREHVAISQNETWDAQRGISWRPVPIAIGLIDEARIAAFANGKTSKEPEEVLVAVELLRIPEACSANCRNPLLHGTILLARHGR